MQLLDVMKAISISAEDAKALVDSYRRQFKECQTDKAAAACRDSIAKAIVKRYAKLAAIAGGASALPGIIPGLGTAIAMMGGGSADLTICLKLQVDMCMCLAECYDHDLASEDAKHLSILLAVFGAAETMGEAAAIKLGSRAGVAVLRRHLRGGTLLAIKRGISLVGVKFTRKALEKGMPFGVGVAAGASLNYGVTRYVGRQALTWFRFDEEERHSRSRPEANEIVLSPTE